MNSPIILLLLDALVAGLLMVTIVYCTKLNRRIRVLQDSKSDLAQLIQQFDDSTQQATRSINEIHVVSKKINENIKTKLDKANYIVDDLTFMIEKGSKLADRMEVDISGARKQQQPMATLRVADPSTENAKAMARRPVKAATGDDSGAEVSVARAEDRLPRRINTRPNAEEDRARRTAGLESMLEKIAQKKGASKAAPADDASSGGARKLRAGTKLRSKAEQELYDALKSDH